MDDIVADLKRLVSSESPSDDHDLLNECAALLEELGLKWLGARPERHMSRGVPHLFWPSSGPTRILLLGHFDTVWPAGTTDRWAFSADGDRLSGPGIFDMKSGIMQGFAAFRSMNDTTNVALLLTGDEELAAYSSQTLIEEIAGKAEAVLVLEPSIDGALKVARKGNAFYRAVFRGKAAHAGLDPSLGANVISALPAWLTAAQALADDALGTTVTPTTIAAGTVMNTVPAHAEVTVDSRTATLAEQERVSVALASLSASVPGVSVSVQTTAHKAPFEESSSAHLFALATAAAVELRMPTLEGRSVGGGSDGNITAALGIPTLDGLGGVGGNAHAEGEWVSASQLIIRSNLLAALMHRILTHEKDT